MGKEGERGARLGFGQLCSFGSSSPGSVGLLAFSQARLRSLTTARRKRGKMGLCFQVAPQVSRSRWSGFHERGRTGGGDRDRLQSSLRRFLEVGAGEEARELDRGGVLSAAPPSRDGAYHGGGQRPPGLPEAGCEGRARSWNPRRSRR